jgi:hypothetical protein
MKKQYVLCLLASLLIATASLGQTPAIDAPGGGKSKSQQPLWGFTVGIPLGKILGKKKAVVLPKQPASSVTEPVYYRVHPEDSKLPSPVFPTLNVDLPELVVVASRTSHIFVLVYEPRRTSVDPEGGGHTGGGSGNGDGDGGQAEMQNKFTEWEEELNECEQAYAYSHPAIMPLMFINREQNAYLCNRYGFGRGVTDGDSPENAFRHALFQVQNVCAIGESAAREMAARHESCNGVLQGTGQGAFDMDTHNNNVGFALGYSIVSSGLCGNELAIVNAVRQAYFDGALKKHDGSPTP